MRGGLSGRHQLLELPLFAPRKPVQRLYAVAAPAYPKARIAHGCPPAAPLKRRLGRER